MVLGPEPVQKSEVYSQQLFRTADAFFLILLPGTYNTSQLFLYRRLFIIFKCVTIVFSEE